MGNVRPVIGTEDAGLFAGRYRLGPSLGSGGMAEVLRAEDTRLARTVAIKILLGELASDLSLRRRFESEARAAARLAHPNVVAVYDVGEAPDGRPFIVMELMERGSLADRLRRGPLGREQVVSLTLDLLAGLGAAHEAGLLHRDIKPGNILLARDGSAKLADFGIAKAFFDSDGPLDLTRTSLVLGTPRYVAPERALGQGATIQSDLWAVGVVLHEALTGQPPFEGATPFELVAAAGAGRMSSVRVPLTAVDERALAVAARALVPDPADRFSSAATMSAALAAAAAGTVEAAMSGDRAETVALEPLPASSWSDPVTAPTLAADAGPTEATPWLSVAAPAAVPRSISSRRWRLGILAAIVVVALGSALALALSTGSNGADRLGTRVPPRPPVRTTTTTSSTITTTVLTASGALGNMVRDVAAGEQAGTVDQGSGQNISNRAQQAITDENSGNSAQAANDLQQAAVAIANGVQHGSIAAAEGQALQQDLLALANVLGLGAAASPPTTAAPGPGPGGGPNPGNGHGPGNGNGPGHGHGPGG